MEYKTMSFRIDHKKMKLRITEWSPLLPPGEWDMLLQMVRETLDAIPKEANLHDNTD